MQTAPSTTPMVTRGDLAANVTSFARHLRAANLSPATQRTYLASIDRLTRFLEARGMPTDVAAIRREHFEAFMEDQLATWKPATAAMLSQCPSSSWRSFISSTRMALSPPWRAPDTA